MILKPMTWKNRMPSAVSRYGFYQFRLFIEEGGGGGGLRKDDRENSATDRALAPNPPKITEFRSTCVRVWTRDV